MAYDAQKLSVFEKAVEQETGKKIEEIDAEIEAYKKQEYEKVREMQYNKMYTYMQEQVRAIKAKHKREVTQHDLACKRELLEYRNSLVEQVFADAKEQLRQFTNSDSYENYLVRKLLAVAKDFPCEGAVIRVSKEDLKFEDVLKKTVHGVTVEADPKNHLGGFTIVNLEKRVLEDETFESLLEDERQAFYERCTLKITD